MIFQILQFYSQEGGLRVFDGLADDSIQGVIEFNIQEASTFRDADGSVSRCPSDTNEWTGPVQVIKSEPTTITENCVYRDNWNMAVCDDLYGKVNFTSNIINEIYSQVCSAPHRYCKYYYFLETQAVQIRL